MAKDTDDFDGINDGLLDSNRVNDGSDELEDDSDELEDGSDELEDDSDELEDDSDELEDNSYDLDDYDDEAFTDEDEELNTYDKFVLKKEKKVRVIKHEAKKRKSIGHKRSQKQQKKRKVVIYGMIVAGVLGIIISVIAVINKYTPTKEHMSGYSYFDVNETDHVLIMLNNEVVESTGIYIGERLYLSSDFVAKDLNQRFYLDAESNSILYTNATDSYTYKTNDNTYQDSNGNSYSEAFNIVIEVDGKLYIDFESVSKCSNYIYTYAENPNRVVIRTEFNNLDYVTVTKDTAIRYRGGIKSLVLEDVKKETKLLYSKSIDGWVEVRTQSGIVGYIKNDCVSEKFSEIMDDVYTDNISSISKNYNISLAWFQVTNATANNSVNDYLDGTQGVTTISPTWYSITSNSGDMSSLASKTFVDNMHAKGLEVWPLLDDFNSSLDGIALYSSKSSRTKMINTLINDAKKNGYDGFNLDCEKVTKESAEHYLQFVRELSVACRNNHIVLSSDNYKPASFNSYYDLKEQSAFVDYIIIMGYDEHYVGSESGSVASIGFVEEAITSALKLVGSEKLINAVPFFTRIWTDTTTNGNTKTTSKAVGMKAALDDLNNNGAPAIWDETVGQYFGSYELGDSIVRIWLEEDRSIEEKMKLIQQYNLAGVAQWKLGLEKKSVWSVIAKYNQ